MIYETKGVQQAYYTVVAGDEWQHLSDSIRNPVKMLDQTPEQLASYKKEHAPNVVYGRNQSQKRSDPLLTRTMLFIDVDEGGTGTFDQEAGRLAAAFDALGVSYAIYPTISHGIKSGSRFRVVIQLDRETNQADYLKVWRVLTVHYAIDADKAGAERSFKQLQGVYIKTTQNAESVPFIEHGGALPVDKFIQIYDENPSKYNPTTEAIPRNKLYKNQYTGSWPERNKRIVAFIADPENNWQAFGGWDNALTSVGGWVYKNSAQDIRYTADIIEHLNESGSNPIEHKLLASKFKSWVRNWNQRG